jgi:hypothetical protein
MKWILRDGLLVTSIAALVVTLQPDWLPAVSRLWLIAAIVLGVGVHIWWLLRIPVTRTDRSDSAPRRGHLREMRDIEVANDFLIAVDYQLLPFLQRAIRDIARDRLLGRRDIDLEHEPMRARQVLGAEVWRLISPDQRREGSSRPSVEHNQLASIVEALERI